MIKVMKLLVKKLLLVVKEKVMWLHNKQVAINFLVLVLNRVKLFKYIIHKYKLNYLFLLMHSQLP